MDEYSSKRAIGGIAVPRKGSGLFLRDTTHSRDGNAQLCYRLGCSGRLNYTKGTQTGCLGRPKSLRSPFDSSCSMEVTRSSPRTCSAVSNARKSFQEPRKKLSSKLEKDSNSLQDESEVSELIAPSIKTHTAIKSESGNAESNKITIGDMGTSGTVSANKTTKKIYRKKTGQTNQDSHIGSCSFSSRTESIGRGARDTTSVSRYGLKNMRCKSITDVLPRGDSYSDSNNGRRKDILNKRNNEGESSSFVRGKKVAGPSSEEGRFSLSAGGICDSDAKRARNWPAGRESSVPSVRVRRSVNVNSRIGRSNQPYGNSSPLTESPILTPHAPQTEILRVSAEPSSSGSNSDGHPNISDTPSGMAVTPTDLSFASIMNRDGRRRYDMDGISEVLLALERIEQDEELTYEQLLSLETSLLLNGLSFYDQHRDMRLDIDNMSYEELLALEEEMGTVTTAVSEEALSKCLTVGMYQPCHSKKEALECSINVEDVKCSICQEEYLNGEEVGRLECLHGYHILCINQWLRLKNWCPICKASVAPSECNSL